ncbi:hypothetical protein MN608_06395 [Microdochium nivale]|nr:hypothetical protein MN608_06395 [Microdochium nivale]
MDEQSRESFDCQQPTAITITPATSPPRPSPATKSRIRGRRRRLDPGAEYVSGETENELPPRIGTTVARASDIAATTAAAAAAAQATSNGLGRRAAARQGVLREEAQVSLDTTYHPRDTDSACARKQEA